VQKRLLESAGIYYGVRGARWVHTFINQRFHNKWS
jgi:hypothetical protein